MIPFLHLGPLTIPTYGLMVATALLVAGYIVQADLDRRRGALGKAQKGSKAGVDAGQHDDGFLIVTLAGIAGLVGSRVYHVLETPREFFANPWPMIFTRYGYTWFGGFLGGTLTLILLARRFKIPLLEFLDMCSPAAAVGYAIGRIGCLLSGDGDYGKPTSLPWGMSFPNGVVPTTDRVHPTPIYEFLMWVAIGAFLWHLGTRALRDPKPKGEIFCAYLILTGIARFFVEFLRLNERVYFGLTNAQVVSVLSVILGAVMLGVLKTGVMRLNKSTAA